MCIRDRSIAYLQLQKPEEINSFLTYNYGMDDDRFPLSFITEFDFRFGPYFVPNKIGTNKKADYNWIRGSNGQDTDKVVRVLLLNL